MTKKDKDQFIDDIREALDLPSPSSQVVNIDLLNGHYRLASLKHRSSTEWETLETLIRDELHNLTIKKISYSEYSVQIHPSDDRAAILARIEIGLRRADDRLSKWQKKFHNYTYTIFFTLILSGAGIASYILEHTYGWLNTTVFYISFAFLFIPIWWIDYIRNIADRLVGKP